MLTKKKSLKDKFYGGLSNKEIKEETKKLKRDTKKVANKKLKRDTKKVAKEKENND